MNLRNKDKEGLFKNIFVAYFILLLHVFLLAGVGLTVVLFKGIYHYLPWIMAGLALLVLGLAWIIYRRMRTTSSSLSQILGAPEFQDRAVEVRLLGGLASFEIKAKQPSSQLLLEDGRDGLVTDARLIESSVARTERKMLELDTLYEKNLITREEFETAREKIIQG